MNQNMKHDIKNNEHFEVLFVDDEQRVLDGLRRQFRAKRSVWGMRFALSGKEAVGMLTERSADVVVTDMRMPGMSGSELLSQIRERWPQTVRFVLSGQTDQAELLEDIGCIHQFLQKPCDPDKLEQSITRTTLLASSIESSELRKVVSGIQSLPIVSQTYVRLVDALNDNLSDADTITRIVEEDVGLSVKILQLVNSAFFGMPRKTVSVKDAIVLIGMKSLLQLVMSAKIFDTLGQDVMAHNFVTKIWASSSDIGASIKHMAKQSEIAKIDHETVCLTGVLSHIGRAILARTMPNEFKDVIRSATENETLLSDEEINAFGISQECIGAFALGIWGFSDSIVEAVAHQETPSLSEVTDVTHPLVWLHLARGRHQAGEYVDSMQLDSEWLEKLGITKQNIQQIRSAA